jgi:hypothetical protein
MGTSPVDGQDFTKRFVRNNQAGHFSTVTRREFQGTLRRDQLTG